MHDHFPKARSMGYPARRTAAALFVLVLSMAAASCSKKNPDDIAELTNGAQTPPPPPATPPEKKPEPPKYVYPFQQQRDPFMPLMGGPSVVVQTGADGGDASQIMTQNFSNLELRGILKDKRGKVALIVSTSGESYVLRSGRIFDHRNRLISGVSGIIKEESVVLFSQNKTVKELALVKKDASGSQR